MAAITCPICCEETKKSKVMACPKCNFEVCHSCLVGFIKTVKNDVTCMSCKHSWDMVFLFQSLPASIVFGDLKAHREVVLMDREIALLPATQQLIPISKNKSELRLQLSTVINQLDELNDDIDRQRLGGGIVNPSRSELSALMDQYKKITDEIQDLDYNADIIRQRLDGGVVYPEKTKGGDQPQIICPCPANECRGFIMKDSKYSCGICDSKICKVCHVLLIDGNHECNKDDIESVKHIMKECKPCPGCGVPSRKTEGCSQVWCISCHKAWNWDNGRIETGRIHATDYLTYLRRTNQYVPRFDVLQPHCRYISVQESMNIATRRIVNAESVITKDIRAFLIKRYQSMAEYERHVNDVLSPVSNIDLRIQYMQCEINEAKWKQQLHKRDKDFTFKTEIHKIRCAYTINMRDMLSSIEFAKTLGELTESIENIKNFHQFMVDEYQTLAKRFKSKRTCPF